MWKHFAASSRLFLSEDGILHSPKDGGLDFLRHRRVTQIAVAGLAGKTEVGVVVGAAGGLGEEVLESVGLVGQLAGTVAADGSVAFAQERPLLPAFLALVLGARKSPPGLVMGEGLVGCTSDAGEGHLAFGVSVDHSDPFMGPEARQFILVRRVPPVRASGEEPVFERGGFVMFNSHLQSAHRAGSRVKRCPSSGRKSFGKGHSGGSQSR